jgi:glycosyltransferase involved in cell wall biosynthesis
MKISIAIPTWECYGKGGEFLDDLLRTIEIQTFKNFEVCISDHSKDDKVFNKVKEFQNKFDIIYSRNEENRGNGPFNTNKSIEMCSGDIIKVMFQDDFFYDDESLEKIHNEFENSDKMWLVNGCNHTQDDGHSFYWEMYPTWNNKLLEGVNTISSPSVLSFRKEVENRFDETLVYFMDCEFYYGMNERYGRPIFLNDVLISNRVGDHQISSQVNKRREEYVSRETEYCIKKYKL